MSLPGAISWGLPVIVQPYWSTAMPILPAAPEKPKLTLTALRASVADFLKSFEGKAVPKLYGKSDGKAVGTYVEHLLVDYLAERFTYDPGNSARGIDYPTLGVDLKVTSITQPQSSCPFRNASQKVYGLGYDLIVLVYDKKDDPKQQAAFFDFVCAAYIEKAYTADFQTSSGICKLLDNEANKDDIVAFIEERNLPLEEIGRAHLADRILANRPVVGVLTISNALQWRLQYGRVVKIIDNGGATGVHDLRGE